MKNMRKYMAEIVEGAEPDHKEGQVLMWNTPTKYSKKGEIQNLEAMNTSTGKIHKICVVKGLGHADFKDEADFKARGLEVIKQKCATA